jgi:hypothetical protein
LVIDRGDRFQFGSPTIPQHRAAVLAVREARLSPVPLRRFEDERNVFLSPLPRRASHAPQRLRYRGFGQGFLARELHQEFVQDVKIVAFSEKVLGSLELRAPISALLWQETFDHIPEAFYGNAQFVPSLRAGLPGPALMEIDDAGQLLENQLRQPALIHGNELGSGRQAARPALPSFARKRVERATSLSPRAALPFLEM